MRPPQMDLYQIDENSFGEILIAVPDLGAPTYRARFKQNNNDLLIIYGPGETVRLPDLPAGIREKIFKLPKILVLETTEKAPVRCYPCVKVVSHV